MNDLFNGILSDYNAPVKRTEKAYSPAVNIIENKENYQLEFSVPGYEKENFSVKNSNGILTVKADVKEEQDENKTYNRRSFRAFSFEKTFTLPDTINAEEINAKYNNGILLVELPKKEAVVANMEKEISIQ